MEKIKYKASVGAIIWWVIGGIMSGYSITQIIIGINTVNTNEITGKLALIFGITILIILLTIGIIFILIGFGLRNSNRKKQLMKKQIEIQEKILANQELMKQQAINNI